MTSPSPSGCSADALRRRHRPGRRGRGAAPARLADALAGAGVHCGRSGARVRPGRRGGVVPAGPRPAARAGRPCGHRRVAVRGRAGAAGAAARLRAARSGCSARRCRWPRSTATCITRSEIHRHIGFYHLVDEKRYDEALRYLRISLELREQHGDARWIPSGTLAIGQALLMAGRPGRGGGRCCGSALDQTPRRRPAPPTGGTGRRLVRAAPSPPADLGPRTVAGLTSSRVPGSSRPGPRRDRWGAGRTRPRSPTSRGRTAGRTGSASRASPSRTC